MMDMDAVDPVAISYPSLLRQSSSDDSITPLIQSAFSSSATSLGLLIISDLPPSFIQMKERLLLLSNTFAQLDEAVREKYADPSTNYSYGWSCGKEVMNGKPDKLKGSFYNNPTYDQSPSIQTSTGRNDRVTRGEEAQDIKFDSNIWPDQEPGCEDYQVAFKDLCALMVHVGGLVAKACDRALLRAEDQRSANTKSVEELVTTSRANKARLLHYVRSA